MPIFFPQSAANVISLKRTVAFGVNTSTTMIQDAIFSHTFGLYLLAMNDGVGFLTCPTWNANFGYSNSGIGSSSGVYRVAEFGGRAYRVRLANAVATAVRSTADLVNYTTDFGGVNITGVDANENALILSINYNVTGGANNGRVFTGTTYDPIYSGIAANPTCCFIDTNDRVFFGHANGIFRYTDDLAAWTEVNLGIASNVNQFYEANGILFCGLANGRIFESYDGGATWSDNWPANGGIFNLPVLGFSGNDSVRVYSNGGFIAERIAPYTWQSIPAPAISNFVGALRRDKEHVGFSGNYAVGVFS